MIHDELGFFSLKVDVENFVLELNTSKKKLESSLHSIKNISNKNKEIELSMVKIISKNEYQAKTSWQHVSRLRYVY